MPSRGIYCYMLQRLQCTDVKCIEECLVLHGAVYTLKLHTLRIYSATQEYNVVLCCIMIKVAVEGCLVLFKGGGEGHIGVRIRGVYSTM